MRRTASQPLHPNPGARAYRFSSKLEFKRHVHSLPTPRETLLPLRYMDMRPPLAHKAWQGRYTSCSRRGVACQTQLRNLIQAQSEIRRPSDWTLDPRLRRSAVADNCCFGQGWKLNVTRLTWSHWINISIYDIYICLDEGVDVYLPTSL